MMRIGLQAVVSLALFWALWFGLSRPDWRALLELDRFTAENEEKLGKAVDAFLLRTETLETSEPVRVVLDSMLHRLANANGTDPSTFHLHVVKSQEINAFALPGSQLVVYTGLLREANSPEVVAGVLAHEMAHIRLGHVRLKLAKELGLAVLLSATNSNASPEVMRSVLHHLSSTAFDRKLETEADAAALTYLRKAGIDPGPLADFFEQLRTGAGVEKHVPDWISTHPDPETRERWFRSGPVSKTRPVVSAEKWEALREALSQ
jgi:predicted Zn-dependent protease